VGGFCDLLLLLLLCLLCLSFGSGGGDLGRLLQRESVNDED
jgi:hypothetical protein